MTLPMNPQDLLHKFERAQDRPEMRGAGDSSFLKLTKGGSWEYGAEDIEVEPGSLWAINPASLSTGFAAWKDNEKVGDEMAPLTDAPVLKHQLPDVGAPWAPQVGMQLKCLSGEDEGTEVLWSTTSKGGNKAFKVLLAAVTAQLQTGTQEIVPMVELATDSYKHKNYGKIYTPVFKVHEWANPAKLPAPEGEQPDPEPEAEPEEVPEPARRRRRRAS